MVLKMNGIPLTIDDSGVNVKLDIAEIIHTPINVDITYAGHHLINGDINMINFWSHAYDHAVSAIGSLF
ncbi:hypothetical protein [Paenibacillus cremeus]|uniref:Uncharacterized protein n=1 Tax=Paenibacillus cremeus TaxID=2163881 RepID=A0A559KCU5_9BACL|nr:hypothetical protein [Paenibacillus cremeus]TVY09950.1 hypothetical protein FPZ49_11300 [Paenibacillus cremeus]